jgi:hypothetical protein
MPSPDKSIRDMWFIFLLCLTFLISAFPSAALGLQSLGLLQKPKLSKKKLQRTDGLDLEKTVSFPRAWTFFEEETPRERCKQEPQSRLLVICRPAAS